MKILYSAYACDPSRGSEFGNGWNWAFNNVLLGHEVWCLTSMKSFTSIKTKLKELNNPKLHIIFVEVPNWVDQIYRYGPFIYFSYLFWQHKAYLKAKKLQKENRFDIVHHTTWGSIQLGSALWKLNIPMVFGPCGGGQLPPIAFRKYFYEFWKTEVSRKWVSQILLKINPNVKNTLKNAKLVLTTNNDTYEMAKSNGAKNVKLFLDTSLPEDFFPREMPVRIVNSKIKILWVGRLFARKGLPLVLEALSKVKNEISFEITVLGEGPMDKYINQWNTEYGLEERITWAGKVSWEEVKNAYKSHDIFMFCSLRDSSAAQLLEAMAYGLPIITLNLHGAKNLVPDGAGIKIETTYPEKTTYELAMAVEELYKNPQKRISLGQCGFNFAKTQTWKVKTTIVNKYYQDILNNNQV